MTALLLVLMFHLPHGHAYGWTHHHHIPPATAGWHCQPVNSPPFVEICTPPITTGGGTDPGFPAP